MAPMDALLTQRHIAQPSVDKGGESVMIVTANQPPRRAASALVLPRPPGGDCQAPARTVALGPGRIAQRHRTTREALVGSSDWPGRAQVFARGRHGMFQKTGQERVEVV